MTYKEYWDGLNEIEREIVGLLRKYIPKRGPFRVLEIGSGWGVTARAFLEANKELELWTIDKIPLLTEFDQRTEGFANRIKRMVGDSKEELAKLPEKSFDLVYIDGDHGYEGTLTDFRNSMRLVKKGQFIIMDDFWHEHNFDGDYGVNKALRDSLRLFKVDHCVIFIAGNGTAVIKV